MPRSRRFCPEGTVQHVIGRFIEKRFYFDLPGARDFYLRKLARALEDHDASLLAFSLMSSHPHLELFKRKMPLKRLIHPVHSSLAAWVNLQVGRLGPVFEDRFKSVTFDPDDSGVLTAYIHNNTVRANVVELAAECSWSSHRAYMGLQPTPPWLAVDLGLELCGFDSTPTGRAQFDTMVRARGPDPRVPAFSGEDSPDSIRTVLNSIPSSAELRSPRSIGGERLDWQPGVSALAPCVDVWHGDPRQAIVIAARCSQCSASEICSRSQVREVTRARAGLLLAWCDGLARPQIELSRRLGLSPAGACRAIKRARRSPDRVGLARLIARLCWEETPPLSLGRF